MRDVLKYLNRAIARMRHGTFMRKGFPRRKTFHLRNKGEFPVVFIIKRIFRVMRLGKVRRMVVLKPGFREPADSAAGFKIRFYGKKVTLEVISDRLKYHHCG